MDVIKHEKSAAGYWSGGWVMSPEAFPDHEAQGKTNYLLAEAEDPNASYSFDDYALVWCKELKKFYLFNTSGCSCPTHEENAAEYASNGNITSWRELQTFIAQHVPFEHFTQMVDALNSDKYEIDQVIFESRYPSFRY
jgi:hypothetical protein